MNIHSHITQNLGEGKKQDFYLDLNCKLTPIYLVVEVIPQQNLGSSPSAMTHLRLA